MGETAICDTRGHLTKLAENLRERGYRVEIDDVRLEVHSRHGGQEVALAFDEDGVPFWFWVWPGERNADPELERLCPASEVEHAAARTSHVLLGFV